MLNDPFVLHCIENKDFIKKALFSNSVARLDVGVSATTNFLLADILDQLMVKAFGGIYLDEDGYDSMWGEYKISHKSKKDLFQKTKPQTSEIIINNKIGNTQKEVICDYIYLVQTEGDLAVAICKHDDIKHLIKDNKANTSVKIPFENLVFIIHPSEVFTIYNEEYACSLKENKNIVANMVESYWQHTYKKPPFSL